MTRGNIAKFTDRKLYALSAMLLAALVVYAPALKGQFLWDDLYLVNENPFFKSPVFILEVFRHHLFLDSLSVYYRPVQNVSYMLDYWLWDKNPFGYHLSNIFFHAISGYLIYLLLKKLLPSLAGEKDDKTVIPIISWLVALVWVIHPIHNAAVAYISGRADSLAAMFAVSAWLAYLHANTRERAAKRFSFHFLAAMLCLAALCSKEIALIWLALFLVYIFVFDSKDHRLRAWMTLCALLAVVGGYLMLRKIPASTPAVSNGTVNVPIAQFLLMLRALGDYASLIFFPWNLHMDRIVFWPVAYFSTTGWEQNIRFEYLSVIGTLVVIAFAFMSFQRRPWQRLRIFGAVWFVIGFLPISNLFPLNAQVAEHWIYMPSIGFLLFIAGCVMAMPLRYHAAFCYLLLLATIGLGIRTATRSEDWRDAETFYKQTIEAGGGTPRVHLNLAAAYTRRGDDIAAEKVLRQAVQMFPDYATARINLGINLVKQNKVKEAEEYLSYDKAYADLLAKTYPHTWSAALNLAQVRYNAGQKEQALTILDEAGNRSPDVWELVQFRSKILIGSGNVPLAIVTVESYTTRHWWHYDSHLFLGKLFNMNNQLQAAREAFEQAGRLDIHGVEPFNLIAHVEMSQHQFAKAYDAEIKAIRREPNEPSQYLLLASILEQLDRKPEADQAIKQAEELRATTSAQFKYL